MKNVTLRSGIIIGIILSIYCIISAMTMSADSDMSTLENIGNGVMFLTIGIVLFLGLRKERDEVLGGIMSYGKVVKTGIFATLIAAVIYSFTWTVYSNISDIQFADMIMEMTINEMQEEGASDDEIALVLEQFEKFMPYYEMPIVMFLITIIEPLFPGIVASLILGFILRRNENAEVVSTSEE